MQINWWTLALQAINFLILIWLLRRFLYRPVKEVIEKRKQLAEQAFADAAAQKQEAEAARQRFEDSRAALAKEHQETLKRAHENLEAERREMLAAAKAEAAKLVDEGHKTLAEARARAVVDIRQQAAELAVDLASTLLRNADAGGAIKTSLEQLEQQLQTMAADERSRLEKDLAAEGARLTVVTAVPLAPEEQRQWAQCLAAQLGQEDKLDFATDRAILGGAELRFPHAVLKFTWADQLEQARAALASDETVT